MMYTLIHRSSATPHKKSHLKSKCHGSKMELSLSFGTEENNKRCHLMILSSKICKEWHEKTKISFLFFQKRNEYKMKTYSKTQPEEVRLSN
jgi:hypothetical protein